MAAALSKVAEELGIPANSLEVHEHGRMVLLEKLAYSALVRAQGDPDEVTAWLLEPEPSDTSILTVEVVSRAVVELELFRAVSAALGAWCVERVFGSEARPRSIVPWVRTDALEIESFKMIAGVVIEASRRLSLDPTSFAQNPIMPNDASRDSSETEKKRGMSCALRCAPHRPFATRVSLSLANYASPTRSKCADSSSLDELSVDVEDASLPWATHESRLSRCAMRALEATKRESSDELGAQSEQGGSARGAESDSPPMDRLEEPSSNTRHSRFALRTAQASRRSKSFFDHSGDHAGEADAPGMEEASRQAVRRAAMAQTYAEGEIVHRAGTILPRLTFSLGMPTPEMRRFRGFRSLHNRLRIRSELEGRPPLIWYSAANVGATQLLIELQVASPAAHAHPARRRHHRVVTRPSPARPQRDGVPCGARSLS